MGIIHFFHIGIQTVFVFFFEVFLVFEVFEVFEVFLRGFLREMGKAEYPETLVLYFYVFKYDSVSEIQFKS